MILRLATFALLLAPSISSAQLPDTTPTAPQTAARSELPALPTLRAHRLDGSIRVDGRLDEAAWALAPAATNFIQVDPDNGALATEQTEVRVLFDDQALYIGARMFDSEPSRIRALLARRDESLNNADLVEFYIDSYHNRVDGFVFRITPAGAVRDAAILANGGQDNSWDAVWESEAQIDSLGWVAELRIPFSQLRFTPSSGEQTWGMQVSREVSRKNEKSQLAFTPRHATGGPARWGTLAGLHNLPRSRHLELLPYATTRAEYLRVASGDPFRGKSEYRANAGGDVRYGLTSSLTLSATVNPDFGQVEVDPARVNLSANELFFPERRPFFVEGADLFRYGRIRSFNNRGVPAIFHSRRIGRPPQRNVSGAHDFVDAPSEATIAGAAKLTGRTRKGLSGGLLDAVTLRETARHQSRSGLTGTDVVEPLTNYLLARARQELNSGNTQFGVIATAVNRDLEDDALSAMLRRTAHVAGVDVNHSFLNRTYSLDGSFAASRVSGSQSAIAATQRSSVHWFQRPDLRAATFDPERTSLQGYTWQAAAAKNSGRRTIGSVVWQGVSPGFESNDMGFQSSSAFHAVSTVFGLKRDEPTRFLRNWLAGPFTGHTWNFDGNMTDEYYGMHVDGRFPNFWNFQLNTTRAPEVYDDRLTRGGPLARRAGRNVMEIDLSTDQRKVWMAELELDLVTVDDGGHDVGVEVEFTIRPTPELRVSVSPGYTNGRYMRQYVTSYADAAAGQTHGRRYVFGELDYHELALETRVDWTFTPRFSVQVFAQPLIADGQFRSYSSLARSRTRDFHQHTEGDGTLERVGNRWAVRGPEAGATQFTLGPSGFSSTALVGNAVARWEYRPGSALFVVWQQRRAGDDGIPGFRLGRDVRGAFDQPPENVFAVKATWWLGR